MEEKFISAWLRNREEAAALGIRLRPVEPAEALKNTHRAMTGNRVSDGFDALARKRRLDLSVEALVVDRRFTALFSDDEANVALVRLLDAGYYL